MKIIATPPCRFCGEPGIVKLTDEQWDRYISDGRSIQLVLPDVSAGIREQLKTGIHPLCWELNLTPPDERYTCPGESDGVLCSQTFRTAEQLAEHYHDVHAEEPE